MGYLIFYVSGLAFSLLLLAIGISLFSKINRRKNQIVFSILVFFEMLVPTVLASIAGYFFYTEKLRPSWLFSYTLSWALLFVVGGVFILITGLKRTDNSLNSSTWPKMKLLIGLFISLIISLSTFWVMDRKAVKELESARSEASAIFDSLNYEPIAEKDNSAPILDKTLKLLNDEDKFPEWFQKIEEPGFDPASKEVREFIKEKGETLNLLRNETKKSYYPEIDFRKEIDYTLPGTQRAGKLLSLEARLKAKDGEIDHALEDIQAIVRMADHQSKVPTMISALFSNVLYTTAIKALEYVVGQHTLSLSQLEKYPTFFPENPRKTLTVGLKTESAFLLYIIADTLGSGNLYKLGKEFEDLPSFITKPLLVIYRVFVSQYDIAYIREFFKKVEYIASLPYLQTKKEVEIFAANFKKEYRGGMLTAIGVPGYFGFYTNAAKAEAYMTAANIGKAAMQYRLKNRRYPTSIDEMIPQFIDNKPIDPFDGTPLKMKREDKVIIFYSVGENGKDDSGKEDDVKFELITVK